MSVPRPLFAACDGQRLFVVFGSVTPALLLCMLGENLLSVNVSPKTMLW